MARKLLSVFVLASVLATTAPASAPAPARAAIDLRVCGTVTAYAAPTALLVGAVTINGIPLVLAAGTSVSGSVSVGANICAAVDLNLLGQVIDIDVSANTTTTVQVCGIVTALAHATASAAGSLTIGGSSFVLGAGSSLPANVVLGANLCMALTLNGFAEVANGTAQANATTTLTVCGQVNAYAAAGATTNGSLTVAGVTRVLAPGTAVASSVTVGAYVRLQLKVDAFARVSEVTVLAVSASLAGACGGTAPTPTPAPTPTASPAPQPTEGTSPSSSQPDPSESGEPSPNPDDPTDGSQPPSRLNEGTEPSVCGPAVSDGSNGGEDTLAGSGSGLATSDASEGFLPDTASIGRAGAVLLGIASPLLLMLGGLLIWTLIRRRRQEQEEVAK